MRKHPDWNYLILLGFAPLYPTYLTLGEADTRAKLIDPTLHLPVSGFKPKSIFRGGDRHYGYIADICNQGIALICWSYLRILKPQKTFDLQQISTHLGKYNIRMEYLNLFGPQIRNDHTRILKSGYP